jgi:glycosyltransferase involved in cell wall biosynthesis
VVATEHNVYESYKLKRSIINRLLAKKTFKMIAVSSAVKDEICRRDSIDPAKVEVIYNGIEVGRFTVPEANVKERAKIALGLDPKSPVIGTISRLSRQKGHKYLLNAFVDLVGSFPELKLLIVGSGPLEEELKVMAQKLGLSKSVIFTGARRDIPEILKALDIFAMPSLWEGFPVSLLEAFATGLPVVASPVGGVADAVEDNVSGLLVESQDVKGLVSALSKLLNDSALALRLGKEARGIVEERFSVSTMMDSMTKLYTDALEQRG